MSRTKDGARTVFTWAAAVATLVAVTSEARATAAPSLEAIGTARPGFATPGQAVVLSVAVTPAALGSDIAVVANLSAIGGPTAQPLVDDGRAENGDALQFDSVYSARLLVDPSVPGGVYSLPVTVTDSQGPSTGTTIELIAGGPAGADSDADGLSDQWELQMGLDPTTGSGASGPTGDPDGDGVSNAQELGAGTHPRGLSLQYFAEGAASSFFRCTFALFNPSSVPARVLVRFMKPDGSVVPSFIVVTGMRRETIDAATVSGLGEGAFSTGLESDVRIVADRTMRWDASGYGSHTETGVPAPSQTWLFAEGATHSGFSLFYLLQNPNDTSAAVEVTYLRPSPLTPLTRSYTVAALSRFNIWVNVEAPDLAATDVSARITADVPIVAERAMYLDAEGLALGAGHDGAGVTAASTQWFMAEGATGPYFDFFVLLANPGTQSADVEMEYLLPTGEVITKARVVPADSRLTVWVDQEDPRLANTALSTIVRSTNSVPVVAERAMWWPSVWREGHSSAGSTVTGPKWAIADGEVAPYSDWVYFNADTYVLVANTSATRAEISVTVVFEDGRISTRSFSISPTSRRDIAFRYDFPETGGRRFGAIIESVGPVPAALVVERSHYSDRAVLTSVAGRPFVVVTPWAAGASALAVRLP